MKIKFTTGLVVNIVIGLALGLMFLDWTLLWVGTSTSSGFTTILGGTKEVTDRAITKVDNLKPLTETISDSVPYYRHVRLQDSINQLHTLRNGDGPNAGSGALITLWGTQKAIYCDTCSIKYNENSWPHFMTYDKPTRCYFVLFGWKLKSMPPGEDSLQFHVEHGQAYLRKLVIDSAHRNKDGSVEQIGHLHDVEVSFGYNRQHGCITIPIKPGTKNILDKLIIGLSIVGVVYYAIFVLGGFIRFLIDVARGRTFTEKNIRLLKVIGISVIALPTLIFLLNLGMPLIFGAYFTDDVVLSEKSWDGIWKWLITGIAFLLLYKAFKNGKKIKDEQDLVI